MSISASPNEKKLIDILDHINEAGIILLEVAPFDLEMESWQYELNIIYAAIERRIATKDDKE